MVLKKYYGTIILIYFLFTFILFITGFFSIGFISDDYNILYDAVNSSLIQKFSGNLPFTGNLYLRPVSFLSLQIDYYIHNFLSLNFDNFINYKIGNLFLFYIFSFLCGRIIYQLTKNYYLSLIGMLSIILFPSNIHNICWTTGRVDLLCGIFYLLYLYLTFSIYDKKSIFFIICSTISLALAFLAKEITVTALPVCLIFIYFFRGKFFIKSHWKIFIIHIIIFLLYFIYKFLIGQFNVLKILPAKFSLVFIKSLFILFLPVDYLSILYQLKHNDVTILIYFAIFITFLFLYFIYLFQLRFFKILLFASLLFFTLVFPYAMVGYIRPQLIIIPFSLMIIFLFSSSGIETSNKKILYKKSLLISFCIVFISWGYYSILNVQKWTYCYDNSKQSLNYLLHADIDLNKSTLILCNPGRLEQIYILDKINGAYNYWKYQKPVFNDTLINPVLTGGLDKESINPVHNVNKIGENEFEITSNNEDSFFYIEGLDIDKEHYIFENNIIRIEFSRFNYFYKPTAFKIKFKNNNINCYIYNESKLNKIF